LKDFGFLGKFQEELVRIIIDKIFGIVEKNCPIFAVKFARELNKAVFVTFEEFLDDN